MENIAKAADYKRLLETISELVMAVKDTEFELEDPEGKMRMMKISNMSINILSKVNKFYVINNCAIDQKETRTEKSLSIRIWIKNKYKTLEYLIGYPDVTLDPNNFRIFFYQHLRDWVNSAYRAFFGSPKSNSKFGYRTKETPEVHIEKINLKPEISSETITLAKNMTTKLQKELDDVREATTQVSKEFTIFLMADTEGRKILTQSNEFFYAHTLITFINKQNYELANIDVVYAMTEKELQQGIKKIHESLKQEVKDHEQIHFLESGWYPIFMMTNATHTLFHEGIAGHLLSGKYIVEEDSKVFQILNKDFSADERFNILKQLTIENKPNLPNTIATYHYDHEGTRAKDIVLMDKGKVVNYLTDRNSAFRLGQKESNGTALASTFIMQTEEGPFIISPEPRISNLVITSHSKKSEAKIREELVNYCKRNKMPFYLEISSQSGQVNPEDGVFDLIVDDCDMVYMDGTRKKAWGGTLSGNLFEFIAAIQGISKETEGDNGRCGSSSGWVPVHGEAPYMTLKNFHFVATRKPEKKNKNLNPKYTLPDEEQE